jgi:hypothetical protein
MFNLLTLTISIHTKSSKSLRQLFDYLIPGDRGDRRELHPLAVHHLSLLLLADVGASCVAAAVVVVIVVVVVVMVVVVAGGGGGGTGRLHGWSWASHPAKNKRVKEC